KFYAHNCAPRCPENIFETYAAPPQSLGPNGGLTGFQGRLNPPAPGEPQTMFKVDKGGAPPRAPARLQTPNPNPTTTTPSPSPFGRDGFDVAPRRTPPPNQLGLRSGGGGLLTAEERKQRLGELRASLGDLDSPGAAEALRGLQGQKLEGLELGLVA